MPYKSVKLLIICIHHYLTSVVILLLVGQKNGIADLTAANQVHAQEHSTNKHLLRGSGWNTALAVKHTDIKKHA